MPGYPYRNLTTAIKDLDSPLRAYLRRRFPHTRPLQTAFRLQSGPLLVPGGSADSATIGAAFDFMTRFAIEPRYDAELAEFAFRGQARLLGVVREVVAQARAAATGGDFETLGRASWVLALCTAVYRSGWTPDSALAALIQTGRFNSSVLLSLASRDALVQLQALHTLAQERLLPSINAASRLDIGPVFDGSSRCPADADLIYGGTLLEIKTRLGVRDRATGVRSDRLLLTDLYQLVAYALFDRSDTFRITALAIYSARYGALVGWPVDEALSTMAGTPVDITIERQQVWELLA